MRSLWFDAMPPGAAQGVVALRNPASRRLGGVSALFYRGSLGGFDSVFNLALHPTDPAKDVLVYLATTTNTAFEAYAPYIMRANATGMGRAASGVHGLFEENGCVFLHTNQTWSVPGYLCAAKETKLGQGIAHVVFVEFVRGATGSGPLGL